MKTAAVLLVAVTLSTSLFLESSAAPDPFLGNLIKGVDTVATGVVSIVEGTIGALVGGKTCPAYILFLTDLGLVLKSAQERLYGLLTDVTKGFDKDIANASGALKELLTKINALLKELLEELPELLKALVAAVAIPTEENLNKVEVLLQKVALIVTKLKQGLAEDTDGTLTFVVKSLCIAVCNAAEDGCTAFNAVIKSLRRN